MEQITVRKVIIFNVQESKDSILTSFNIGETFLSQTNLRRRLEQLTKDAVPTATAGDIKDALDELARTGISNRLPGHVISCEDGVLYYHLLDGDVLDVNNANSPADALYSVREWAKQDECRDGYVDGLTDAEFCREWHFNMFVTEAPIHFPRRTPISVIAQKHPIGYVYKS